jgi:hypothetical protein
VAHSGKGRDSSPSFVESEDELHEAAVDAVGFDDFGDESYLEGLRVLLDSLDRAAKLTPAGREMARQDILETLKKRLRAEKAWMENPSILTHEIRRPIVILGMVRTGSTALHYLMGQDPGIQKLEYWLASTPQPRPPRGEWEAHPDFQASMAELDAMYEADPSLKAVHMMMPEFPEECRHLLAQNFTDHGYEVRATIPSYSEWYDNKFLKDTYVRHRKLVQLIGSTDPDRRWLLKYPVHVRHLRALLEVYPDACIIQTHRDPTTVMHSCTSMVAGFRALHEDDIDPVAISREQMELWASGLEKGIECRRDHDSSQFFDLQFAEFRSDPIGSVKRIYDYFGQELSEQGEKRLIEWQESNPQYKHGKHDYSEQEIGITDKEVLDRFSAYMEYFQMRPEKCS